MTFLSTLKKSAQVAGDILTAKGDILTRSASALSRLAVGSNDQILTADSGEATGLKWATASGIPSGVILMWSGAISAIPSGWVICDGNNSTPNLIAKFIRCVASNSTDPGSTGGADTVTLTGGESGTSAHSHSVTDPGHVHGFNGANTGGTSGNFENSGSENRSDMILSNTTGISIANSAEANADDAHQNMPAYFALAYIMKT